MKFKDYLALITAPNGFIPLPVFQWAIQKNPRKTAREEAIAAEVIRQANPRENISGSYPWGPEQQIVLQQLWINPDRDLIEWRDVPMPAGKTLYSVEDTQYGPLPVPNAIQQPETIVANFHDRIKEALGE